MAAVMGCPSVRRARAISGESSQPEYVGREGKPSGESTGSSGSYPSAALAARSMSSIPVWTQQLFVRFRLRSSAPPGWQTGRVWDVPLLLHVQIVSETDWWLPYVPPLVGLLGSI